MARTINKLSAAQVKNLKVEGRHSDGGGLYLKVTPAGKRWVFMYDWEKKRVELGLGTYPEIDLLSARKTAFEYRSLLEGTTKIDPRAVHGRQKEKPKTFGDIAREYVESKQAGWKNEKHRDQWYYTLSLKRDDAGDFTNDGYCVSLRDVAVADVSTDHILSVLEPIWRTKPETASRLRGRIEAVLDAARSRKLRTGENPALWRGHLSHLLSEKQTLSRGHHSAMPYGQVTSFVKALLAAPTASNSALAFTILTAARSGETLGALWPEIEWHDKIWRIPASRMKGKREHVVPLSEGAVRILKTMDSFRREGNDFIFAGQKAGKGLSVMALTMAMRRFEVGQFTPHGFRSAFRDWAGDATSFARDDIEMCLAHAIGNKVEAAYRRGKAIEKRREIMSAWWKFVSSDNSNVATFPKSSTGDAA